MKLTPTTNTRRVPFNKCSRPTRGRASTGYPATMRLSPLVTFTPCPSLKSLTMRLQFAPVSTSPYCALSALQENDAGVGRRVEWAVGLLVGAVGRRVGWEVGAVGILVGATLGLDVG